MMIREHLERIARHRAALPVLLLLALGFRLIRLDTQELGYDEMLTAFEANGLSMERVLEDEAHFRWRRIKQHDTVVNVVRSSLEFDGGNGLLFAIVLHGWTNTFGNGTFAWRSLCVALGVLLIVLLRRLVLLLGATPGVALLAASLATLHAQLVDYAQEVRCYTLGCILVLATLVIALAAAKRTSQRLSDGALLGCLATGAFFSHYFTACVLLLFAAWYWLGGRSRLSNTSSALAFGIPIIALASWAVFVGGDGLRTIIQRNQEIEELVRSTGGNAMYPALSIATMLKGLSLQGLAMIGALAREGQAYDPPALLLLPVAILLIAVGVRHSQHGKFLLVLVLAAPINGIILTMITGHTVALRTHYAFFSAPFAIILIALGMYHLLGRARLGVPMLLPVLHVLVMTVATVEVWKGTTFLGPDRCANDARHVEEALRNEDSGEYHLVHGSRMAALILGLHLRGAALDLPTIVRPITHTTLLVRSAPTADTLVVR